MRLLKKLLPFIAVTVCFSQVRIGEWKALTSPLKVREIIASNGEWFAATEGGLFKISQEETRTFTTVEGLKSVDLSALAIDQNNHIWMGGSSPNGFVQIFDPMKIQSIDKILEDSIFDKFVQKKPKLNNNKKKKGRKKGCKN